MRPPHFPWRFFILTFLLTWAFWIPAGFFLNNETLRTILHYTGGLTPTLVTLYLLYRYEKTTERKDFWQRFFDLKRISLGWYLIIFLTVPLLTLSGVVFDILFGGNGLIAISDTLQKPLLLLPFAPFIFVFGPLPEEIAWRGYALDKLQTKWNALVSSLILGAAWTIWHLPLFFIIGTYQHGLGIDTPQFWLYMLDKIPMSVLMTWIFNNTKRSTASAVLFHFMVNFTGELVDLTLQAEIIYIAAWWFMAVIVMLIWKPQNLDDQLRRNII
ncbi:MAG: type II CAAX endopeptidase family protein [Anaerolineae bacterium]|jgi:membrane protease YdiL (CAAX protease family)|nr:type II CAAX endopeptidase family protein [Anaerolineae bacterium]